MDNLFEVDNIKVDIKGKCILNIDRLSIPANKIVSIIGPNGAGKTTLLKNLLGMYALSQDGKVLCLGEDVLKLVKQGKIAWVSQHEEIHYSLNLFEYILLGCYPQLSFISTPNKKNKARVLELIDLFDLSGAVNKRLSVLSGGERQRAALARALMQETNILLLDEPNNHLDIKHQHLLMKHLQYFKEKLNMNILIVLHDLQLAANYTDYIILMKDGNIHSKGLVKDVMNKDTLSEAYNWEIKPYLHNNILMFNTF